MIVEFRAPRWGDVNAIAPRMREIERVECAVSGMTPKQALRRGLLGSAMVWTGTVDGRAEAMFGVIPVSLIDGEGIPWMLGTDRARLAGRRFLTIGPKYLEVIANAYPRLENHVHRDNLPSIRWLKRLNFAVDPEVVQFGDTPMRRFSMDRS